ncbi:hemolysin family protein [Lacticaseibacillus brantae]|uniref:Hemolysin-like protein n=1 Tax=Lacticaseibacillus brantae DSM 23927 TaxID=1423727 RepID=A0A0R2BA44_9LACO|nr:hemolysin family protein [Lacticaseibacillus brantae]KRM72451.1 hemolysin-like protein [Lacticaseibacillus brantae DSM 23927]
MGADPDSALWGQLILIVVLTLINAFFAATEIALVSLSQSRMQLQAKQGDKRAAAVAKVMANSANFLATIQVGITFAGFFASASAATTLAGRVQTIFGNASWAHEGAIVLVTIGLSYISLVFGELYPKQLALQMKEQVAKFAVGPIGVLGWLLRPFVWLLSASTRLLMKLTPIEFNQDQDNMTRDEMVSVIETGRQTGAIEPDEYEMFEGIISLNQTMAREVMVPRTDAFMIDINDPDQQNIDAILGEIYSRIPVFDDDKDKIVGLIHIKDLLKDARKQGFGQLHIRDIMVEPWFVPETITVDDLLTEMRAKQRQMAILLDEYGGVVGLVTIEDLIEEIVGEIDDESDQTEVLYTKVADDDYIISGRMPINDFNELFETDLNAADVDTIAGYVIAQIGMIPGNHQQQSVAINDHLTLITGEVQGSRLVNLHLKITPKTEAVASDD